MPDKPLPPTPDYQSLPQTDPSAMRCENCGLLAQFRRDTRDLVPAEELFRRRAKVAWGLEHGDYYDGNPVCVAGKRNFQILNAYDNLYHQDGFGWLKVLREDMSEQCAEDFIRWVPGLSIKDHKEMLDRKYMTEREDRRDAEMRTREDERDARVAARDDAQDRLAQERHDEQMKQLRGQHWRELFVFGLLIGVATLCAAILDGAVSRGWQPGWWPW